MQTGNAFLAGFIEGIRPDRRLSVWEWADENRVLSSAASAEPGRWRTDRVPFAREVMECLSVASPYEEIVFMKASQVGGTEAGNNWLGYIIDHAPGPSMLVLPTTQAATRSSKQRIAPMIEDSPALQRKVKAARSRDSGNTLLVKEFAGGVLIITGANSAVGLRSMPARNLFLDEIDAYPHDVDDEGDPVNLAIKRTSTFKRTRKILKVSTPLVKESSRIERDYLRGDQRRYHVPCPECGELQEISWSQIVWDKSADGEHLPQTAKMACVHCGVLIGEHHKTKMLEAGRWVAQGESNGKVVSFHISALYSPLGWYSWADAVQDFLDSKEDPEQLQVWTNTVLGESFARDGERPDEDSLITRRQAYAAECPMGVLLLVASVDVQDDRLEAMVHGYGIGEQYWPIDKYILYGDPSQWDVWQRLDDVLGNSYTHETGAVMNIAATCIDSGGHHTQMVYDYVRKREATRKVWAIIGRGGQRPILSAPSKKKSGYQTRKVDLFTVGVDMVKGMIYRRLQIAERGPGYFNFPLAFANGDVLFDTILL